MTCSMVIPFGEVVVMGPKIRSQDTQIPPPFLSSTMPIGKDRCHIPSAQDWLDSLWGSVPVFLEFLNFRSRGALNIIYSAGPQLCLPETQLSTELFQRLPGVEVGHRKGRLGKASIQAAALLLGLQIRLLLGFPGGAVVKNPPANAGDTGSSPGPGRSHMPRSG